MSLALVTRYRSKFSLSTFGPPGPLLLTLFSPMDPQDPNLDPAAAWGGQAGAQPAQPPAAAAAAPPQAQQPITMNATDLLQVFYQGLQNMS